MGRAIYVAFANPVHASAEEEFNRWFDEVHIPDVLTVTGIASATRYRQSRWQREPFHARHPYRYMTIYDIDADDLNATLQEFERLSKSGQMVRTDSIQQEDPIPYGVALERVAHAADY
jgi:hypothetical protein